MFRILVADKLGQDGIDLLEQIPEVSYDIKTGLSEQQLIDVIGDYDGLIVRSASSATAAVIDAGKKLKVIGRAGIGVDNIDIKAATNNGVIVMNTPQANSIATAEHAMTMMLAVARHTAPAHASLKAGDWEKSKFVGIQLYRRVLGLVGFGKIARRVAKYAQGFDMEVWAYDPYVSEEVAAELKVKLVNLDELLSGSDFISLHTVATPETENIINAQALDKMKSTAILVNSARGKLIDEAALHDALVQNKIRAAAIDVYWKEPATLENPLIGLENLLHLPHIGATTEEAQRDVATQIVQQVCDALLQRDFRNSINMPFPAGTDFKRVQPFVELGEKIGLLQATMAESAISRIEIEISGDDTDDLIKPIACGCLQGVLKNAHGGEVNYINAPIIASEHGIVVSQAQSHIRTGYDKLITVTCHLENGHSRSIAGTLFNNKPRIIRISDYILDVDPKGTVLVMLNEDIPGVIGKVGTLLADHTINIAEWRLGRTEKGKQALAFISLDAWPSQQVLDQLLGVDAVTKSVMIDFG